MTITDLSAIDPVEPAGTDALGQVDPDITVAAPPADTDIHDAEEIQAESRERPPSDDLDSVAADEPSDERAEPALCWLPLDRLRPNPDNPRTNLGDLTELTRSIRAQGILEPLLVLPVNEEGEHLIVAGHRRHAAALKAGGIDAVPVVVRAMTPVEVIEAMLSENVNRSDLTVSEEVRAIERLMTLDTGVTPARLCRRIGRSKAWVRARMAVTVLPAKWRAALDSGEFTLAAGEAAAAVADLGPDHLDAVCERLDGHTWGEPTRIVEQYRDELRRTDAYHQAITKAQRNRRNHSVFTSDEPPPTAAKPLSELLDNDGTKAHSAEPCHAVMVKRLPYGDGHSTYPICTHPRRHSATKVGTPDGSDIITDRPTRRRGDGEDYRARRQGRVARIAHIRETFARTRGGISQTDLTRLALRALVHEAHHEAIVFAADFLGIEGSARVTADDLLAHVTTPAALARVAGAVALGVAETRIYYAANSEPCRDYLELLTRTGWEPDPWTADCLGRNTDADSDPDDIGDSDDDGLSDGIETVLPDGEADGTETGPVSE